MKIRRAFSTSILPLLTSAGGCLLPVEPTEHVAQTSEGLSGTPLPSVPATPLPAGFGNYCSVVYPNGSWYLRSLDQGDSCAWIGQNIGQGGTIMRAGYWSINHNNNAMVRCDGGLIYIYRLSGIQASNAAYNAVPHGYNHCVFTVSPVALPIFGWPYDSSKNVSGTTVFTYDHYLQRWDPTQWGRPADYWQIANCPDPSQDWCYSCAVDRTGTEKGYCQSCASPNYTQPWTCQQIQEDGNPDPQDSPNNGNEPAYDWGLPAGTKLLAVADGIVRGSQCRDVHGNGMDCMEEVFIESQIGSGNYAEHFVAAYHHMDPNQPIVATGAMVKRGDTIGIVGESGTGVTDGSNIHLDFQVLRLTNLTGAREYTFAPMMSGGSGYGFNGWQGIVDPFGWAAPQGVDPASYMFIGYTDPTWWTPQVTAPDDGTLGAFSINLWLSGVTPPTNGPTPLN